MLKLLRYLKPYKWAVLSILMLTFLQSISQLYLPTLMADIVDVGIVNGDINYITDVGVIMLLVALVITAATICASYLSAKTALGFSTTLRRDIFAQVESFSLTEFDKFGTASLITRTTNDITQIQRVMIMMLRMALGAPLMMVGGVIMAVSTDAKLSLIIIAGVPILVATIYTITKKAMPLFKLLQMKLDQLSLVMREGLTGIRVIRAFNRTAYEQQRFHQANWNFTVTAVKVNRIMATIMPVMTIVLNFTIVAVIWFGSMRIDSGHLQVGDLMAFIQYIMHIMFSLMMVSMIFVMIPRAQASAIRINEVLETKPEIQDAALVKQAAHKKGWVEFKDVTFSYPGAEKPAISNISFKTGPGETTAIIGGTGSGKSTLISLIPRFYDVDSGQVLVDGIDVREMAQQHLRSKIGYVPQRAILFSGTIADNLSYGKEGATPEELTQAANTAQATEFIGNLPGGLQAEISQGGTNLSGGQKQRLAIARALVRKPEIYVFDDSFSALDFKTDACLRTALKKETANATVIIVAQRVSTVMHADQIIVLDKGKIVGIGKHQQLLNTCSVYQEIVSSQLSEEDLA
ncbi:ABC transporter ATP-binding protein [Peptococcaceae bacterium 1198_IL3148]